LARVLAHGVRVVAAGRDQSTTFVVLCLRGRSLPARAPVLRDAGHLLHAGGVRAAQSGGFTAAAFFFPPTESLRVDLGSLGPIGVLSDGLLLFPRETVRRRCGLVADAPFTVESCGALIDLRWRTGIRISPRRIGTLNVRPVGIIGKRRVPLDFYLFGLSVNRRVLVVSFAMDPPHTSRVVFAVSEIDLLSPAQVVHPGTSAVLRLHPAASSSAP